MVSLATKGDSVSSFLRELNINSNSSTIGAIFKILGHNSRAKGMARVVGETTSSFNTTSGI